MTLTGILEITGVILEQRTWRHTDIQTDWYAGIITEIKLTPSTGLRCHRLHFVYSSLSHYFVCLYFLVIDFVTFVYRMSQIIFA